MLHVPESANASHQHTGIEVHGQQQPYFPCCLFCWLCGRFEQREVALNIADAQTERWLRHVRNAIVNGCCCNCHACVHSINIATNKAHACRDEVQDCRRNGMRKCKLILDLIQHLWVDDCQSVIMMQQPQDSLWQI